MMSLLSIFIITSFISMTHGGMTCSFKSGNIIQEALNQCPNNPFAAEKEYCCLDLNFELHCCEMSQFFIMCAIIAAVAFIILSCLGSLICCCLCPCCFCYKKRRGMPI